MIDATAGERFRLPVLKTRKGDISKRWFVEYYAWQKSLNDGDGGLVRRLVYCPAKYKTSTDRKRWGRELIAQLSKALNEGNYIVNESGQGEKTKSAGTTPKVESKSIAPLTTLQCLDIVVKVRESKAYGKRSGEYYRNVYRRFDDFLQWADLADLLVNDTTSRHIYQFSDYILQERRLSSSYRNNLVNALNTLFADAVKREYLIKNPTALVETLPVQTSRRNLAFVPKQREQLEEYLRINDPTLFRFTRFIYQAFIRPVELTRLQVRDIDLEQNRIVCHSSITKGGSRKQRTEYVEITTPLRTIIDSMKLHKFAGTDFIFGQNMEVHPEPILRNRVSERHQAALIGAKLYNGELTMYSWKHTGVVNAFRAGASIEWLQKHLRHSDLKDTVVYLKSLGLMLSEKTQAPEW